MLSELRTCVLGCFLICIAVGCTRQTELSYSSRAELDELPEIHQSDIENMLFLMFGTPSRPRMRMPVLPDEEDDAEAAQEAADGQGGAEAEPEFKSLADPSHLAHGARVYNARCAGCHGVTGDGLGSAAPYLLPTPRDYRGGVFKFTSTPYGMKPARQDLVRTVRRGAKGTSMPAFRWMSERDLEAVIDYIIMLSVRGEVEAYVIRMAQEYFEDESIELLEYYDAMDFVTRSWEEAETQIVQPMSPEPPADKESIEKGFVLFRSQGCSKCHGEDAKGQTEWLSPEFLAAQKGRPEGQQIQINYDAWGAPAPAADITARMLHGGRRPIDVYRRIATGINGTPMPAFASVFADEPDKIWHLVHYILYIIEGGDPTMGGEVDVPEPESDSA